MTEEQKRTRRSELRDIAYRRAEQLVAQYRAMGRDISAIGVALLRKEIADNLIAKAGL